CVFTATASAASVQAGMFSVTVIDYTNAKDELSMAIEQVRAAMGAKGVRKYDEVNNLDMHRSWRMTVETPNERILGEILIAANNRLYIAEGHTPLNLPPP